MMSNGAIGTPLARALESDDEVLIAAATALMPAHVLLSHRNRAKIAADAMEALKKLTGISHKSTTLVDLNAAL